MKSKSLNSSGISINALVLTAVSGPLFTTVIVILTLSPTVTSVLSGSTVITKSASHMCLK